MSFQNNDSAPELKVTAAAAPTEEKLVVDKFLADANEKPPITLAAAKGSDVSQNLLFSGGLQANSGELALAIMNNPYLLDDPYVRRAFQAQFGIKPTDKTDIQAT